MKKSIQVPPMTGLRGPEARGRMAVQTSKPPKLRWQPGSMVRVEKQLYEIMYCFRVKSDPHEWFFCLEERKSVLQPSTPDLIQQVAEAFGCGKDTPRIVYDMFKDSWEANSYFSDIPANADRWVVSNKTLMSKATLVSSGEIVTR